MTKRTDMNWDEQVKQAQEEIRNWPQSVESSTRLDQSFSAVAENFSETTLQPLKKTSRSRN